MLKNEVWLSITRIKILVYFQFLSNVIIANVVTCTFTRSNKNEVSVKSEYRIFAVILTIQI